jgi:hypothetical protein
MGNDWWLFSKVMNPADLEQELSGVNEKAK